MSDDINSSPVSLPAGSYDYDELKKGLDKAAKGSAKSYDDNVFTTLGAASKSEHQPVDTRNLEGYRFEQVENGLGGTENIQVFDAKLAEKEGVAEEAAPASVAQTRRQAAAATGAEAAAAPVKE